MRGRFRMAVCPVCSGKGLIPWWAAYPVYGLGVAFFAVVFVGLLVRWAR
jgi:hypothetical protein